MIIDTGSIKTAKGCTRGTFIVMAGGEGIHESIGCSFDKAEHAGDFMKSFKNNKESLREFMPDSDYTKVTRLYIA